jgi:uncharacterized delta-60 repeat protein
MKQDAVRDITLSKPVNKKPSFALTFFVILSLSIVAVAQAGRLDRSFSNGGIFNGLNTPLANSLATAVAIQSDGKILIAGQFQAPGGSLQPCVARLTSSGTLDHSFGQQGVATVALGHGGGQLFTGVIVQPDGKIVVALSSGGADAAPLLALARFEANGALDTGFGTSGILVLAGLVPDSSAIAQQPDGKILVGGGLLMARVNSDGSLDTTFGNGGFAAVITTPSSITLQSDGKILLPASRYSAKGSVDTTFGTLGRIVSLGPVSPARVQGDGKIVAAGTITSKVILGQGPTLTNVTGFGLTRYSPTGTLDGSFGHQGGAVTDFSNVGPVTTASDLAIESNGDIVVAGQAGQPPSGIGISSPASFALARYTPTGALDITFGSGGKLVTSFGKNATASIAALAVDGEGRLVAVGTVSPAGTTGSIVVARYLTK